TGRAAPRRGLPAPHRARSPPLRGAGRHRVDPCGPGVPRPAHGRSSEIAPALLEDGMRVIDLGGDFRLPAEDYPGWYGFEQPAPTGSAVTSTRPRSSWCLRVRVAGRCA